MGEYPLICDVCNRIVSPSNVGQTSADSVLCLECLSRLIRKPNLVETNSASESGKIVDR